MPHCRVWWRASGQRRRVNGFRVMPTLPAWLSPLAVHAVERSLVHSERMLDVPNDGPQAPENACGLKEHESEDDPQRNRLFLHGTPV